MKKYNYKYLIGFILGMILCGGSVYAAIMYQSNIVSYNSASSNLTSSNVQAAIDELATNYAALSSCPSDKYCVAKKSTLALGDYILYTPSKTSYTTDKSYTGRDGVQTIYPNELTLWRVLSLNQDGTVDIISEDVSSSAICFAGKTGYQNLVGYLNVLASQYENSTYTAGSRYFGYSGQTEFITDTTYFVYPQPWTCSTGGTCNPDPDDYEAYGGGDTAYLTDFNLVNSFIGGKRKRSYWIASRYYMRQSATLYDWIGRILKSGDGLLGEVIIYRGNRGNFTSFSDSCSYLRPIVTLKSTLSYSGLGTEEHPMEIQ